MTRELVKSEVGDEGDRSASRDPDGRRDAHGRRRGRAARRGCASSEDEIATAGRARRPGARGHYGAHQDLEWAIDGDGELFLLQSRPETVWSRKQRERIADPNASMMDRISSLYTGR